MAAQDVNEAELAKRSNINQPTVHRILSGESKNPRLSNLAALAKTFSVSVLYLTSEGTALETDIKEPRAEYNNLSPAASKLIRQIKELSSKNMHEADYMIISQILERLSKK